MFKQIIKSIFPQSIIKKIVDIKNIYLGNYVLKSYSQEGEDIILHRLFNKYPTGFYIDVGAHHPIRFSNTYLFYKKGWRGINIDAMPGSMKPFNKLRPNDINIEQPVSDKKEILTYYAFNEPALNGFSKELSKQREGYEDFFITFTKEMITSTLEEILDTYLPVDQEISFLSIDVEGLDFSVLKSNDFNKYRPKVILIEILESNLSNIANNEISRYLENYSYTTFAKTINTVFFIDKQFYNEWYK
ncbi:FkbM family methyltransferase [Sulfuricurvum sp.]|uniref:FkbM family methyltransferase n=1 Tax=Sulfuricurvum sp. TaxID=2025608 RepID=UPI0026154E26|nr:FkbM family methyltransferase [Sulfuricurvum sp.]MDD3597487.1 FkbM family methyltransferase [Sulfuricurvum sp.]